MSKRIVVAIDGPAGAGKSTIAKRVAQKLGFVYIDTGAMYRAIGLWALRLKTELSDMHRLEQLAIAANIEFEVGSSKVLLNGEDITDEIRSQEVSDAASKVSAVAAVRRHLVDKQRTMAETSSVVMEGRDIGTVVFPDADVKIFLDAEPEIRADRRLRELQDKGTAPVPPEKVAVEMRERDERDRNRAESPLMQAPDAVYVDSSALTPDEVEQGILKVVRDRTSNGKELKR